MKPQQLRINARNRTVEGVINQRLRRDVALAHRQSEDRFIHFTPAPLALRQVFARLLSLTCLQRAVEQPR
jgi:hypothetical protein